MEDYVTYEQALRLKELGFDWKCNHWYNFLKELKTTGDYYSGNQWSFQKTPAHADAPTLSQAQKWLREVKKIYVFSHIIGYPPRDKCKYYWKVETNNSRIVDSSAITERSLTYEQALSAGIDKALELLK